MDTTTHPVVTTCTQSRFLVQDVGATFGSGGAFTSNSTAKVNLHECAQKKVWKKVGTAGSTQPPTQCEAVLHESLIAKDGLNNPTISEEGRRFTAGLMCQLSDQQITDMFKVARVAEMPEFHNSDGSFKQGQTEDSIVQAWVTVFKQKRGDIASGRFQWKNQPADLTVIDNPARLATVPNFCSSICIRNLTVRAPWAFAEAKSTPIDCCVRNLLWLEKTHVPNLIRFPIPRTSRN